VTCPACQADNDEQAATCFACGRSLGPSPSSVRLGSVVAGRYEILALLGRGGMGVVYKAHDRTLDETVALKLLRLEVAGDPGMAQRFRSEIKLARKVRHENVCGIHEYGEADRQRYIAMEYVEGVNLRDRLQEPGGIGHPEAFELSIQAAHGLQAIHEAGIIHRDLKPSNIMRDAHGFVRLMDFGIAKRQGSDATIDGRVSGTPEYMSPEQARGKPLDPRSDIYTLAVVVYELFAGQVPFRADTPVGTALKHLHEPPPLSGPRAARLPEPLLPVLRKALAKQPAERHATARDLALALAQARDAAGIEPLAPRSSAIPGPAAVTQRLAPAGSDPDQPTRVELETLEPGVTATQGGLATVTELEVPAPASPTQALPPASRADRRLALAGAAVLLGALIVWALIRSPGRPPASSPTPVAVAPV
jgi:serine/threonine-protein kinase